MKKLFEVISEKLGKAHNKQGKECVWYRGNVDFRVCYEKKNTYTTYTTNRSTGMILIKQGLVAEEVVAVVDKFCNSA